MKFLGRVLTFLAALCFAQVALADVGPHRFLVSSGVPGWVAQKSTTTTMALDFANGRYWVRGAGNIAPTSVLSVSRNSPETSLLPTSAAGAAYLTFPANTLAVVPGLGVQIYEARTNYFLNSTAPVTQTITIAATGSYTIWCNGSGSLDVAAGTAVGTNFGTVTTGNPRTVSITTTGTIVVTVTGSLQAVQVENGAFGTPFIVTAGTSAQRLADVIQFAGRGQTNMLAAQNIRIESGGSLATGYPRFFTFTGNTFSVFRNTLTSIGFANADNLNIAFATFGSGNADTKTILSASFGPWGKSLRVNGGSIASNTIAFTGQTGTLFIGSINGSPTSIYNGYFQSLFVSPVKGVYDGKTAAAAIGWTGFAANDNEAYGWPANNDEIVTKRAA